MSPEWESNECKQQYLDSIQQSIRETATKKGYIPEDRQRTIDSIFNTYINSENYQKNIEQLYQSIDWLEPDQDKFEDSFRYGLSSFIKYSQYNQKLSRLPTEDIVQAFNQYCRQTINSFSEETIHKRDKQPKILHLIIKQPRLFTPTIYQELLSEIPNNPFLSPSIIRSILRLKTKNIHNLISKKAEIFNQLIYDPEITSIDLTPNQLRLIIATKPNPKKYILENYSDHIRKEKKVKQRKTIYPEDGRKIIRVDIEGIIEKVLYTRQKIGILSQHQCNPEKLAELQDQVQGLNDEVSKLVALNSTKPRLEPRKKKQLSQSKTIESSIPENFKHQAFFQDRLIQIARSVLSKKSNKDPSELWKNFLEIKRSAKKEPVSLEKQIAEYLINSRQGQNKQQLLDNQDITYRLFDNQAIKYLIASGLNPNHQQLSELNSTHQELESLYQGCKTSYFAKGFFLKAVVLIYKNKNIVKNFIGQTYGQLKQLEIEFSQDKNRFVNGDLRILLHYILRYKESARQKLKSDTTKYLTLFEEISTEKFISEATPELAKNILRYAIIQNHLDSHEFVTKGKTIYKTLQDKYGDNQTLGTYLSEAILVSSFFFQEKAEEHLTGLIKRICFYQNKYPKIDKELIIKTIIRYPHDYPQRLKHQNENPSTEQYIPRQMSLEYPLYKLSLQIDALKSQEQTSPRVSFEPLN